MNAAQSRALVALFDRVAELRRQPVDELHLGAGHKLVTIDCITDSEIDEIVNEEGWQAATVWTGGYGCGLLIDNKGVVYGDCDDEQPVPADLVLMKDGRIDWVAKEAPDA